VMQKESMFYFFEYVRGYFMEIIGKGNGSQVKGCDLITSEAIQCEVISHNVVASDYFTDCQQAFSFRHDTLVFCEISV